MKYANNFVYFCIQNDNKVNRYDNNIQQKKLKKNVPRRRECSICSCIYSAYAGILRVQLLNTHRRYDRTRIFRNQCVTIPLHNSILNIRDPHFACLLVCNMFVCIHVCHLDCVCFDWMTEIAFKCIVHKIATRKKNKISEYIARHTYE